MAKTGITSLVTKVGSETKFEGWVDSIRDHGNLIFLDIRDRSGVIQVVVYDKKLIEKVSKLSPEDLVMVKGKIQKRPEKLFNPNIETGEIEVASEDIDLITASAPLPFEINQNTENISELIRLKYRYLDLRSERMKNNLKYRHLVNQNLRDFLNKNDFWEIETPSLTKGTPEGAREFIVPSRVSGGKILCPTSITTTIQTAADGCGCRKILPNRQVLS